jgi:tRNA threonylcarbamoyladenosine biosynthesis protein TsaB
MMILSINTSTAQFSIALLRENGALLAEYFMSPGSKNFHGFMPTVDDLLTHAKVDLRDVKGLIAAIGPGSFTGLRVGLSAAKGLCQALEIPIIGVSSLEAMASQWPHTCKPVCPIIDSRKGEVFAALFQWSDGQGMARIKEDTALKIADLPSFVDGETLFLGNDFSSQGPLVEESLGQKALLAPATMWALRASSVGHVGLERFHKQDFDALRDLVPSYMRPPDIRPNPFPLLGK